MTPTVNVTWEMIGTAIKIEVQAVVPANWTNVMIRDAVRKIESETRRMLLRPGEAVVARDTAE